MAEICFSRTDNKIKLDYWAEVERKDKNKDNLLCQSESGMSEPAFEAYAKEVVIGDPLLRIGDKGISKSQYDILKTFARANNLPVARVLNGVSTQAGKVVWLHLADAQVKDIRALKGLTNLLGLNLSETEIGDISPLKGLTTLRKLDLSGTTVSDLSDLEGLVNLRELNLTGTKISDISSLRKLSKLEELRLSGTMVIDISILKGMPDLKVLALRKAPVSDINVIKDLAKLELIDLRLTRVTASQVEELHKKNPRTIIFY